jgi:hypothetical protein
MRLRQRLGSVIDSFPLLGRPVGRAGVSLVALPGFVRDWLRYRDLPDAEPLRLRDATPCLTDRLATSPYDPHYFQQAVWAAERIYANDPAEHVDVGSQLLYVGMLAARIPVTFVDIRPLELSIAKLRPIAGNILGLPFADQSIQSLSSLHVVEHIGLGRYGDSLNPRGTREAVAELQRVLAPGGNLFLSLPVGRPRVCFNAHRIHDPRDPISWVDDLDLVEFATVDDDGRLRLGASLDEAAAMRYGCGLFWFRRGL